MRVRAIAFPVPFMVLAAGLVLSGPASSQQISRDLTIVNSWKKEIKVVSIQAFEYKNHEPVKIAGSEIELARGLRPGTQIKVHIDPGGNAKFCNWLVGYDVPGGGGGGMYNLCGKTQIIFTGNDLDLPDADVK